MPADSSHQIGQTVGARLRAARLAKKYTQNQLARPDFSVSYISAIERGQIQPSLRALEILAHRLEVSTTDLLPVHTAMMGTSSAEIGRSAIGSSERDMLVLEARLAIYQKEPERAIEILRGQLPQKGERYLEKASEVYYVLGWAYLNAERWQESEQLLAETARLARESTEPFYPCILSLQSVVYTAMHNTEQAEQIQRESLRVLAQQAETGENAFFQAQLRSSLAQHYSHSGAYEQAHEQYQEAVHLLESHNSCQHLQANYRQLFADYLARELYSLAQLYCYKESLEDFRCQLVNKRSEIAYALGHALLRTRPDEAHSYVLAIAQEAQAAQDHLSLAGAHVQLALWLSTHGELDEAERLVSLAMEQIKPFGETLISADAQLLAGELAYKRKDFSNGDSCFESGLALFERVGAKEDLREHLAHYAQLLEERNCIQKALVYWKRAFASQQENRMFPL
ncbi:MAG TPA: helix-turn-helix domain-containing protein [Ktedonobacteraceae bacterium]